MDDEFHVFDEWGNYVGRVTPQGSGLANAVGLIIGVAILWTVGFLIYLMVKLIIMGARAARRGRVFEALAYWAVPGFLAFFLAASILSSRDAAAARELERQQRDQLAIQQAQERYDLLRQDSPVTVLSAKRISCIECETSTTCDYQSARQGNCTPNERDVLVTFFIRNGLQEAISFRIAREIGLFCPDWSGDLSARTMVDIACMDQSTHFDAELNSLVQSPHYERPVSNICISYIPQELERDLGPTEPIDLSACMDISPTIQAEVQSTS